VVKLTVMVIFGVIIALGKLLPRGELVARFTGLVSILGGIFLRREASAGVSARPALAQ
jgi:hypothetical protein